LSLVKIVLNTLGMTDYRVRVGLRDPDSSKFTGNPEQWDKAEAACREAAATLGVPFTEVDTVNFGAGVEQNHIVTGAAIPAAYLVFARDVGYKSLMVPFTVGWLRDDRDSAMVPSRGRLQRVNGEVSPLGDAHYFRAGYQLQQYVPLNRQFTLAFNSDFGWGQALGKTLA
jgi:outer membrane protein insertion porin family